MFFREYYWANYATGLGASLHELGHTFDLAHTATGIMARGFDDLHKVFTIQRLRGSRCSSVERQRYSSCSSSSNISRTPSMSSLDDGGPNGGSSVNSGGVSLDIQLRRYKDICYGSPFKRVRVCFVVVSLFCYCYSLSSNFVILIRQSTFEITLYD